ncbi:MAG: gliding motility-associated C-terminal domain-containing protein [Bacteroidales bacterium]|nr:gliding motility-associated C-terminal domain-containing protein [Bacteroidales bacterium]
MAFRPGAYVHPAKLNPLHLLFLIVLLLPLQGLAQTDTAFWFAVPDLSHGYGNVQTRLVFHTYDQPATITVEQPANSFYPTSTFNMAAHGTTPIDLSLMVSLIETAPVDSVLNRGFYIHSTAPVTCYYQSTPSNRETYTLKGQKALGTEFLILSPVYNRYLVQNRLGYGPSLEMIATEDSTIVTITKPIWTDAGSWSVAYQWVSDSTFQIRLNRGQSYALRDSQYYADLTKTKIHATRPIAVSFTTDAGISHNPTGGPYHFNLAGEQLLPLPYWGKRYIQINQQTFTEMFRSTDYTDTGRYYAIYINGRTAGGSLGGIVWNFGGGYFLDSVQFIESERPIGMVHQMGPNLQMGFTVLPQLDCAGSNQIAYLRSGDLPLTIHMIIESHAVGDILLNGNSTLITANNFKPVPGLPSLAWCNMDVSSLVAPDSVMHISCSTSKFILAVIESDSNRGTSYTYLTDYAPYSHLQISMMDSNHYCEGDSIIFQFESTVIDSIAIHGPDGVLLTAPPYVIPHADTSMSGQYVIESFSQNQCHPYQRDSIIIVVSPTPTIDTSDTIAENQLPWGFRSVTVADTAGIDTSFFLPGTPPECDTLIHYHLRVYRNTADSAILVLCPNTIPFAVNDSVSISSDTVITYLGQHGEDSIVTYRVILLANSDTAFTDTILERQLPWFFMDTLFNDTVSNYPFHLYNEQGCDSIIHYSLYIFWDGDRCDTTLTFPTLVTPNGDGVNDRFVIGGLLENNCFRFNDLLIYDRTGQLVYHGHNIASEEDFWDPAAHRAPDATYFYVFKAHGVTIHTMHQGVIEVLR